MTYKEKKCDFECRATGKAAITNMKGNKKKDERKECLRIRKLKDKFNCERWKKI